MRLSDSCFVLAVFLVFATSLPCSAAAFGLPQHGLASEHGGGPQRQQQSESGGGGGGAAVRTKAPDDALLYFIWPSDGTVIKGGKFWLRMGLRNMGVAPKGVDQLNVGHHHLLIDAELPPLNEPIPSDRNHLHFGAGESETRIELPPGKHTLQLMLGDQNHRPHDPPVVSKKITITVK